MKWEFLWGGVWIKCQEKNNVYLSRRFNEPSLEAIYLTNDFGELWGKPERNQDMKFRLHGDDVEYQTTVREYVDENELPIHMLDNSLYSTLLPPMSCKMIMEWCKENVKNEDSVKELIVGTEKIQVKNGRVYQEIFGKMISCEMNAVNISNKQYEKMTTTRFHWEFNPPFRPERMRLAVEKTCKDSKPAVKRCLNRLFLQFNQSEDSIESEYGSYQFDDYLIAHHENDLACKVMDNYYSIQSVGWTKMDPMTNFRIEKRRKNGHSSAIIMARGEKYMLIFDSGGGASGQPPVVIKPERYHKILNSMEEQFRNSSMRALFDALDEIQIDVREFICSDDSESLLPDSHKEKIMEIYHKVTHPSHYMLTRIQQFLPALLEKYKECEVRMANQETLLPKRLCRNVAETIENGLNIPLSQRRMCPNFKQLIHFIHDNQSWDIGESKDSSQCHICLESCSITLNHCGSAKACLKCWVDTLVETSMKCPFCRNEVMGGQLKCTSQSTSPKNKMETQKNKKRKRFRSAGDVLDVIKNQYSDITLDTVNSSRKWYTILVRSGILDISDMPECGTSEHNLIDALSQFKVL